MRPARSLARALRPRLSAWEERAVAAVGLAIAFWGFKANHGRIWALLYLRGAPMNAAELGASLGLSKGAVSMVTRELERWGVIRQLPGKGRVRRFEAESDLLQMVSRVIAERESRFVRQVKEELEAAAQLARLEGASRPALDRVGRMLELAQRGERAVQAFLATARFDASGFASVLKESARAWFRKEQT